MAEAPATPATASVSTAPPSTPSTSVETPSPAADAAAPPTVDLPADVVDEPEYALANEQSVDWAAEADAMEQDETGTSPAPEPVVTAPPAPAAPVTAAPTPQPVIAEPPTVAATTQPKPPAAPEAPSAPKPQTPEEQAAATRAAEEFMARRAAELETSYKLPDELASQLQTEPEVVLPKLAAKMHMAVTDEVMRLVRAELPQAFQMMQFIEQREVSAKKAFYDANPDLTGHEQQVEAVGMFFRQQNPNATPQEAIQRIGELARVALGLAPRGAAPALAPTPQPPAAPASRPAFRPATPSAAGPALAPPSPGNPWEVIADELLMEDRG